MEYLSSRVDQQLADTTKNYLNQKELSLEIIQVVIIYFTVIVFDAVPKSHFLDETVPLPVSVKVAINGREPELLLAVKDATGGSITETFIVATLELVPLVLFTVRFTE
jgi:hypothetical protein